MEYILDLNEDKRLFKPIKYTIDDNGCWNCISHALAGGGYPVVKRRSINKSPIILSRYVYEILVEKIPPGHVIRHSCDNPLCINPNHLSPGTQAENMQDMANRARANNRLSVNDMVSIKNDCRSYRAISKDYGIGLKRVGKIKNGKIIL